MLIVDVRSPTEFAAGHVDGAVNIPLDVLEARAPEIPRDALVVTVCGKGGGRSAQAADLLRARGFASARSLCGGTEAWLARAAQGA
ncbi:MAG TPA: rhodanese-like domain-containing protein [Thermoanaerobaculia bacterium]|nr:rhodanese-like domain-containing protein [Thermoanaerobaculia bacterium]